MKTTKVKESRDIVRMRNRLQKHLKEIDKNITPDALTHMSENIKDILARKAKARTSLKKRTIVLFDQNRHPAKDQKATLRLRELVKRDYFLQ